METDKTQRWLPIESNPDVMNKFLYKLGLPEDWSIQDVYSLDEAMLAMLPQPVLAILVLLPLTPKITEFMEKRQKPKDAGSAKLYFMKQTISNACGTVAMLHSIGNNLDQIKLKPGSYIDSFFEETAQLDAQQRAQKLELSDNVSRVHEEVAKEGQTAAPSLDDQVDNHFISLVLKDGGLYGLDGRQEEPFYVGPSTPETFLKDAAAECRRFMDADPDNIHFTLLALAKNSP